MMAVWQAVLIMLGVLAALALLCVAALYLERRFPSEKYDERQKLARGNAYRLSFWVGEIYYLIICVYLISQVGKNGIKIEPYLLVSTGFIIQGIVFHIYCLMSHAALPLGEKPGIAIGGYLLCGALQFTSIDFSSPLSVAGYDSHSWTRLATAVFFLSLGVTHLIRLFIREKE